MKIPEDAILRLTEMAVDLNLTLYGLVPHGLAQAYMMGFEDGVQKTNDDINGITMPGALPLTGVAS